MTSHPLVPAALRWAILVPIKPLATAKSRLALPGPLRSELTLAMAGDVVEAALDTAGVELVVIVADDATWLDPLRRLGVDVVVDPDRPGLNASLRLAAGIVAARDGSYAIASLVADVPAVTSIELTLALKATAQEGTAFAPDAVGSGSTLVAAARWASFLPEYGPQSRRRHIEAGFCELAGLRLPGLRQDVDTVADLAVIAELGPGRRTRRLLGRAQRSLE